jgi:hypothetical protein
VLNSDISLAQGASPDKRNYRVDCTRLPALIPEYEPQWNARRGAQELYDAYQRVGLTLEDFEGRRYKRIDHVRDLIEQHILDRSLRVVDGQAA